MSTREERLELRLQGDAAYTTRAPSVTATALRHHHFKLYGQGQGSAALPQVRRTKNDAAAASTTGPSTDSDRGP